MVRTKKACVDCRKPFYGGTDALYCEECARKRKSNVIRIRVCKQCGKEFQGGPRAFYCPECRVEQRREASRRARERGKTKCPLGSIDRCEKCGSEYIVASGRQKYCTECKREAMLEWQRKHKKGYDIESGQYDKKIEKRKNIIKICVYCGREFHASTSTNSCSDYCRGKQKQIKQRIADSKRGINSNIDELIKDREEYRKNCK